MALLIQKSNHERLMLDQIYWEREIQLYNPLFDPQFEKKTPLARG